MTTPPLIDAARAVARRHLNNSGMVELVEALEALPPDAVIVSRALLVEGTKMIDSLHYFIVNYHGADFRSGLADTVAKRLRQAAGEGKP